MSDDVLAAARQLAAEADGVPVERVRLLETLSGTWIARGDRVVVKVHPTGTDPRALAARLRLAAVPELGDCVLAPLRPDPVRVGAAGSTGAWVTVWPRVEPLPQDVAAVPWAEAGALLARLHLIGVPDLGERLPAQGSVARVRASLDRLAAVVGTGLAPAGLEPAVRIVQDAARRLPAECWTAAGVAGRPRTIVHGDWHLGQFGRVLDPVAPGEADRWRLIDVDDLGLGDPVWDLARPAGFWAAGLMPDADWGEFVHGYRSAGGPALPPVPVDPWPAVDAVARAGIVLAAAGAVRRAIVRAGPLEEADARLVEICGRLPDASW